MDASFSFNPTGDYNADCYCTSNSIPSIQNKEDYVLACKTVQNGGFYTRVSNGFREFLIHHSTHVMGHSFVMVYVKLSD